MIEKLAFSLGRNDELPNIELAQQLCKENNAEGIKEIVEGLKNKDKRIANDCIKVLYEIGDKNPALIAEYADVFINLLNSRSNRLVWGSMTALASIAELVPEAIHERIALLLQAFENGSVITVDNCVSVLAGLCKANEKYKEELFPGPGSVPSSRSMVFQQLCGSHDPRLLRLFLPKCACRCRFIDSDAGDFRLCRIPSFPNEIQAERFYLCRNRGNDVHPHACDADPHF